MRNVSKIRRLFLVGFLVSGFLAGCIPQHEGSEQSAQKGQSGCNAEAAQPGTPANAIKGLGSISGAVYDRRTKRLVLLGSKSKVDQVSMRLEDLAVALRSLRDDTEEPRFSLDPADKNNPQGPELKAAYYGPIEHTHFGQAMFDADWLLKAYSFGKLRANGQEQAVTSTVPGYKNIFDLNFEQPGPEGETWTRFWITADKSEFSEHKDAVLLDNMKMKVNTEKMWATAKGLESSGGQQDPNAERFAAHFTENYDLFAKERPAFREVKELAKAVALAKWIEKQDIAVDPVWIDKLSRGTLETPKIVGALSASQERSNEVPGGREILTLRLFGGVDLAVEPVFAPKAALGTLETDIKAFLAKPDASPVFSIMYEGKQYPAMVVPITDPGKIMWGKAVVSFLIDGRAYVLVAWLPPEAVCPKEDTYAMPLAA